MTLPTMTRATTALTILLLLSCSPVQGQADESHYYTVEPVNLSEKQIVEVGGIATFKDQLLVCTRRGDIWRVSNPGAPDPSLMTLVKVFEGLHEPLGMCEHNGWLYVIQRAELSRLKDGNGDGWFDELETVCDRWPLSGNYHEYNFGPRRGPDDEGFYITTNKPFGGEPFGRADWRGFALHIGDDGTATPKCCGLRSPAGVERSPDGRMFYTDNQGEWCGAGKLSILQEGEFHGHPWGLFSCEQNTWPHASPGAVPNGKKMIEVAQQIPTFRLPAIWFPYDKMGKSPAGFRWDQTDGAFGPFSGQIFVTDQHHASLLRVTLEEVEGHMQGACYPFRKGLGSGAVRACFTKDGSLFVGGTDRGWGGLGKKPYSLDRVRWTGRTPFEIHSMTALAGGFRLRLTQAVDPATAVRADSFSLRSYTYLLHDIYGSPEVDTQTPKVTSAILHEDRRTIDLEVDGLRAGYVHELHADGLRSAVGTPLLHSDAYYTLINIPGGPCAQREITADAIARGSPGRQNDLVSLFPAEDTKGWMNPYTRGAVERVGDEVHLTSKKGIFFFCTEKTYEDFIFEAEVNVPVGGNSGLQFRSHFRKDFLWGYQAEVDTKPRRWSGGLYDQGRRAWIRPLEGLPRLQEAFVNGQWNHYRIECIGDRIRIFLNGVMTTDIRDPLDLSGHIALQHHGEAGLTYRFRNVRLKDLGAHRWMSIPVEGADIPSSLCRIAHGYDIPISILAPDHRRRLRLPLDEELPSDVTLRMSIKATDANIRMSLTHADGTCTQPSLEFDATTKSASLRAGLNPAIALSTGPEQVMKSWKPDDWNDLVLAAHGPQVQGWINGVSVGVAPRPTTEATNRLNLLIDLGESGVVQIAGIDQIRKMR